MSWTWVTGGSSPPPLCPQSLEHRLCPQFPPQEPLQGCTLERVTRCWDHLDWIRRESRWGFCINCKTLAGGCGDLLVLWRQSQSPYSLHLLPAHPEGLPRSLVSPSPPYTGASFRSHPENFSGGLWTNTITGETVVVLIQLNYLVL